MIAAKAGQRWTESEIETLKRLYPSQTAKAIGDELGRSAGSVFRQAINLGLTKLSGKTKIDTVFLERVRTANADGYSDADIAIQLGCARCVVGKYRRQMGLPSNQHNERHHAKAQAVTRASLQSQGFASLVEYRTQAYQDHAERNGWPSDLKPKAVAILNALESLGPMTRRELCDAIGVPWKGPNQTLIHYQTNSKSSYLAELTRRGLVVSLGRTWGKGRGNSQEIYSLSLTAERRFPDVAG